MTYLIDLGQSLHLRPMQDPQRQAHHLQVLASGGGGDVPGLRPHVEDDAALQPGNEEVCALVDDGLLDALYPVEDDGPRAAPDVVYARLQQTGADEDGNCESRG